MDKVLQPPNPKKVLLWLRLGQSIRNLHFAKGGEAPCENRKPHDPHDPPEKIAKQIEEQTLLLQATIVSDASMQPIRNLFGIRPKQYPQAELVQTLALILFNDLTMRGEETTDSISYAAGVLFSPEVEGRFLARTYVAELLDRKLAVLAGRTIQASRAVHKCLTGENLLLTPGLDEFMLQIHFHEKAMAAAKEHAAAKPAPPSLTPQALFAKLKEYIVSNDSACRLLSVRGALHLNRRELLRTGVEAGSNECILLIGQSGTGKTYIAETFGRLCGLPFASLSASNFTATGYVGLDPDDALKTLVRSAGDPKDPTTLEKARYGVLFLDEWDKRRANTSSGVDVAGSSVQYEWLRLISGTKLVLGARRYERDDQTIEFNSNGTFFVFAGAFSGLEPILKRLARDQTGIGFGGQSPLRAAPRIYEALEEFGLIPEFLNRVTAVIPMKPLDEADLILIATSQHGPIQTCNRMLAKQGLSISIDQAGLAEVAGFCVDSKLFARGIRLIVSAVVEDLVFNEAKGDVVVSTQAVKKAIERITSVAGIGGG